MTLKEYRRSTHPDKSRPTFCKWLNQVLQEHRFGLEVSQRALRSYELGERAPPLQMAIAIAEVTGDSVGVQEWPYLKKRYPLNGSDPTLLNRLR